MTSTNRDFRERLLQSEQTTPSLKQRYEQQVATMMETRLTGWQRGIWLVTAVGGLGLAGWFATLAVTLPAGFPLSGRIGFGVGVLFALGWAVLGVRIFRRGSMNLKVDTTAANVMVWVFTVLLVTLFMVGAPETLGGLRLIVSGLVFLVGGAVFLLGHFIQQSQLQTREKMLELEYRMAELAELIKSGNSGR